MPEHRASLPFVVVGVVRGVVPDRWLALCDVVVDEGDDALDRIAEHLDRHPVTAVTLALLLRGQEHRSIGEGLVAESAAYSVLQSGPEFAAWRAAHPARTERDDGPRVRIGRDGGVLSITLTRPARRNALDAVMRDELADALTLAAADPDLTRVELRGEGAAFCAGGDLDEFGTRADPATAHVIRLERSLGRMLARLGHADGDPSPWCVHGVGYRTGRIHQRRRRGAGHADRAARDRPRAGAPARRGHDEPPRRIGRLRTAWLAFSGCTIDATTAHAWGLVDELAP